MSQLRAIQSREARDSTHYFPNHEQGVAYLAVALAGEVGEICNVVKKYERGDFDMQILREELRGELPDVLIYLVMLAAHLDLDLQEAYVAKKEYNNARYKRTVAGA